jgi:hypothetical protein
MDVSRDGSDYGLIHRRSRYLALLWALGQLGLRLGLVGAGLALGLLILSLSLRGLFFTAWSALLGFGVSGLLTGGSVCLKAYVRKRAGTFDTW